MKWTKEQQEAIDLRNKNILVAAAAGSGKTAVLVERIKNLILQDKCPVDRMLIVTFTNAAAAEMKEKIQKAINGAIEDLIENGGSKEQIYFLKKQLNLLPSSNISTFHSFALDVIRRYFYLIQIEPNFKICDTTEETLLKGEAMDQLLDELFEQDDPEFYHFLKCYSGDRNENKFRELIDNAYKTIGSLPEPFAWLDESVRQLKDGNALKDGIVAKSLFDIASQRIQAAGTMARINMNLADDLGLDGLVALCQKDGEQVELLSEAMEEGYEALRSAIRTFKLPTLSSKLFGNYPELKSVISDNRDFIKKKVKDLKDVYFSGDFEELCHEMSLTYDSAVYLTKLLRRYDQLYKEKKAEKGVVDFGDIEHYAYEILKDQEAANFYKDKFEYIFIDEYQDSNVIQEALVDLIKRPANLFMVGDVKQSIYKFRLAEPEIFQKKYRDYAEGVVPNSTKIDLNKNFRSKRKVIDFINTIFCETMEGYDEAAQLYVGDPFGDESYDQPVLALAQVPWDEDADIDDELKNIIKAQKEAMAAAKIIKEHLGTEIFDSKKAIKRPLEKRDIVILMRGVKNYGDVFHKVLTENNLPAFVDDNDGFFNTMEIDAFLSALYIIDNPKQDIPFMTLLRSEMIGFSIEEMVAVRIANKKGSYYDAFVEYSHQGNDAELARKCAEALEKIEQWRHLSRIMPLDQLIWKMLMDTGFYVAMGAMPAGTQRQANLRALTDKALSYQNGKNTSLYGFIKYVEAIKENKVSMGQVKMMGEKDDLIRIMTIHKSKGLEFPMVLVAGYCRKLRYSSAGKAPLIHKDLGLAFPLVDPKNRHFRTTLLQNIIKDRYHKEEVEEEKRILYVALTRAKDKLILLGMCNDLDAETEEIKVLMPAVDSYFRMTGRTISRIPNAIKKIDDKHIVSLAKTRKRDIDKILSVLEDCKCVTISPEVKKQMEYEYPYREDMKIRTKYSVSQLNNQGRKAIESLDHPEFIAGEKSIGPAMRGTIYHTVLEKLDVKKALAEGRAYIETLLCDIIDKEMITPKEKEIIDISKIEAFAVSELGERIAASNYVCKEKRFNFLTMQDGHQVMVRGIIDCFFEEDDQLVLVDYKTGNSRDVAKGNEEAIVQRYSVQMNLYKEALENATGKKVKEIYLYLTDAGKFIKM
ncbi:MAG: helicase-exonuclease AddAB subunit AddA [Firmicutes bacterium]|nr:helicase-exonuclease AddAB subunit AddA [Bacillota bacterium]